MAAGPNEERLRRYLDPARKWQVFMAKEKWKEGASALQEVSDAVLKARPLARENLGNHTADAADKAFVAMHDQVLARQQQMQDGETALADAIEAMQRAEAVRNGFDADGPLSEPAAPDWDEDEVRQIQQMKSHNARMSAYNGQVAAREEAAAAAIQDLDSTNTSSAQTMRKIQGDRPDAPSGGGDGGGGGAGGGGVPSGGRTPTSGPRATNPPDNPPTDPPTDPPADPPADPPVSPPTNGETGTPLGPGTGSTPVGTPVGTPGTSTSPGVTSGAGNLGGLAGAVGGGLAGGAMGMGGATRGGLGAAAPTGATRAIGSSGRSASSGALGRGAAAGSTSGRGSAARGAGGRAAGAGAGAGGRGKTGSAAGARGAVRGAAGGAGGRGGRPDKDEKKPQIDAIIDDQDWVDDEDAAPGVIS